MYNYSNIKFIKESNRFLHNLNEDYGCFIVWEVARSYKERIRNLLSLNFEILFETEIEWSSRNFHNNASRLYEDPLYDSTSKSDRISGYGTKIGHNVFTLFVIKDYKPNYSYAVSTSKIIELSNLNVMSLKKEFREWVYNDLGVEYAVHATDNIYEFFVQGPLLLGVDLFKSLLNGNKPTIKRICKDLEGADGWSSWTQVFEILNLSSNYLLLKNYESIPFEYQGKDIVLLTDNYQRLASALGVLQSSTNSFRGLIQIENKQIPITMMFVGDKFYCTPWQKDMLNNKIFRNDVFVLPDNMYFFSLLYYCKVRKNKIKEEHRKVLNSIAKRLNFTWYNKHTIFDNVAIGKILWGYFKAKNYYYENPIDNKAFINKKIICYLPDRHSIILKDPMNPRKNVIKKMLRAILPERVYLYIHKVIWRLKFSVFNSFSLIMWLEDEFLISVY